jgi:hypothetical protein
MHVNLSENGDMVLIIDGNSINLDHKKCDELIRIIKRAKSDSESIIKLNKRKNMLLNNYKTSQNIL